MRFAVILLLALLFTGNESPFCAENLPDAKLLKVVVLSRHGVRSPTQDANVLNMWSHKPWPKWPVEKGELTERGARLVERMWANLHKRFMKLNLLPADICPNPEVVYIRADVDERTKATGRAMLNGLARNCKLGFAVIPDARVDPLFHPLKAGLYSFNPIEGATDVLSMTDGGLSAVQDKLSQKIALLAEIAGPPEAALCARFAMTPDCTLNDLPNAISIAPNGNDIRLVGALNIASSMAEIFLLEYAQWPDQLAGWGQVTEKVLQDILPVHSTVFDIVNRAHIVAWAKGSSLLQEMTAALSGTHPDERCNKAKLVIYAGHDTNIANLGALLQIKWQGSGYAENEIPPGSAIALELWEKNGSREVVTKFFSQTPKTLHTAMDADATDLTLFAPTETMVEFQDDVTEAKMKLPDFIKFVNAATKNAPIAPYISPPLDFAKIIPKPAQ